MDGWFNTEQYQHQHKHQIQKDHYGQKHHYLKEDDRYSGIGIDRQDSTQDISYPLNIISHGQTVDLPFTAFNTVLPVRKTDRESRADFNTFIHHSSPQNVPVNPKKMFFLQSRFPNSEHDRYLTTFENTPYHDSFLYIENTPYNEDSSYNENFAYSYHYGVHDSIYGTSYQAKVKNIAQRDILYCRDFCVNRSQEMDGEMSLDLTLSSSLTAKSKRFSISLIPSTVTDPRSHITTITTTHELNIKFSVRRLYEAVK